MNLTNEFYDLIKNTKQDKTKAYDTQAEVTRTEGSTLWVHIPGGVDETPIRKTINAKPGDIVQVRVSGGSAWAVGNASAPPTDDQKAIQAESVAINAQVTADKISGIAEQAQESAEAASSAAATADAKAVAAGQAADRAEGHAQTALTDAAAAAQAASDAASAAAIADGKAVAAGQSAASAASSANNALTQLSTVEQVVDMLTWISEHATYKASTDTEVVPGKYYFTRSGTAPNYTYTVVVSPTGDPSTSGYYEIDTIDEAVSNYIETHLALTAEGLWLIPDDANGNRVLVATGAGSNYPAAGTYIIGSNGEQLARFTSDAAVVGKGGAQRLEIRSNGINGYNADSVNFFKVDYNGGQITANGSRSLDFETEHLIVNNAETTLEITDINVSNLLAGTSLSGTACSLYIYNETGSGFKAGTSPTLTNCTLASYSTSGIGLNVSLPTITVGTNTTFTATAVITRSDNSTLTAKLRVAYTASNGVVLVRVLLQGSTSAASEYNVYLRGGAYSWSVTTTAPAFMFGTWEGTPGPFAVSLGEGLYATKNNQTAIGKYNVEDTETQSAQQKALIIGNGTADNARSNAFSVDFSGYVEAAGSIWADGNIEADGNMSCNGVMSPLGDLVAGGEVEDGSGNLLSDIVSKLTGSAGSTGADGITIGNWKICWGSYTTNTNSASGSGTFAAPYYVDKSITNLNFSGTPYVWAQAQGSLTGTTFALVTSTTSTSATIRLMASAKNTTTRTVRWLAIGKA